MRALLLAVLALTGCPHPPPQPVAPVDSSATYDTCAATAPASSDVCPGRFTADGLACVRCPGASGCLDALDEVYCVVGGCSDPRCKVTP